MVQRERSVLYHPFGAAAALKLHQSQQKRYDVSMSKSLLWQYQVHLRRHHLHSLKKKPTTLNTHLWGDHRGFSWVKKYCTTSVATWEKNSTQRTHLTSLFSLLLTHIHPLNHTQIHRILISKKAAYQFHSVHNMNNNLTVYYILSIFFHRYECLEQISYVNIMLTLGHNETSQYFFSFPVGETVILKPRELHNNLNCSVSHAFLHTFFFLQNDTCAFNNHCIPYIFANISNRCHKYTVSLENNFLHNRTDMYMKVFSVYGSWTWSVTITISGP